MMLYAKRIRRAGFTLIEIMIAVAIIAILTLIAIPNYTRAKAQSQFQACMKNCQIIGTAMETYLVRHSEMEMFAAFMQHRYDRSEAWSGYSIQAMYNHTMGSTTQGALDNWGYLIRHLVDNGYLASEPICPVNGPLPDTSSAGGTKSSYKVYFNMTSLGNDGNGNRNNKRWAVSCRDYHRDARATGQRYRSPLTAYSKPFYVLGAGSYRGL